VSNVRLHPMGARGAEGTIPIKDENGLTHYGDATGPRRVIDPSSLPCATMSP
jgi:hypothetical protein